MKSTNIIVVDEAKFEAWLRKRRITYVKEADCYKLSCKVRIAEAVKNGVRVMKLNTVSPEKETAIDSNKIGDLELKMSRVPEFFRTVLKIPAVSIVKNPTDFILTMQSRLTMGSLKYGGTWKYVDLAEEISQELYDVAAYAYLEWLKQVRDGKLTPQAGLTLMTVAANAMCLWQLVKNLRTGSNGKT